MNLYISELGKKKRIFKKPHAHKSSTSKLLLIFSFADFLPFHSIERRINLILNGGSEHIFNVENVERNQNVQKLVRWRTAFPRVLKKLLQMRKEISLQTFLKILT